MPTTDKLRARHIGTARCCCQAAAAQLSASPDHEHEPVTISSGNVVTILPPATYSERIRMCHRDLKRVCWRLNRQQELDQRRPRLRLDAWKPPRKTEKAADCCAWVIAEAVTKKYYERDESVVRYDAGLLQLQQTPAVPRDRQQQAPERRKQAKRHASDAGHAWRTIALTTSF
jgi:hypothetical protein